MGFQFYYKIIIFKETKFMNGSGKERVLAGMRPTGSLHLGHYVGALENWVKLQDKCDCHFLIADYQALGDYAQDVDRIRKSVRAVTLDWLSVGLDPRKSAFLIQSYIPEYAELAMLLSMITSLNSVDKNPTLRSEMKRRKKEISLGFYNYPASQAADILLSKASLVPAGEDQVPHIELAGEVAKSFNKTYGYVFPEPKALVGRVPRLIGTDGKTKMGKSSGNCIYLSDDPKTVAKKVKKMAVVEENGVSCSCRVENSIAFAYLNAFCPDRNEIENLKDLCHQGRAGNAEAKELLLVSLNDFLDPIRERRSYFESHPQKIREAIMEGTVRAKKNAQAVLAETRSAMRIANYENV